MTSSTQKQLLFIVLAASLVSPAACRKEDTGTATSETGAPGRSTTSATAPSSVRSETATQAPTVSIEFFGLITHILGGKTRRAVLVRNDHHTPSMHIPANRITEEDLKEIWPNGECDKQWCTAPLDGWAVRFASEGSPIAQPASVTPEGSFRETVPHLAKVTGSETGPTHKKFKTVHSDVTSPKPPKPRARIFAWVELPPGSLSATEYPWTAKFDPDYEHKGPRRFGREIHFKSFITQPTVEVANGSTAGEWIPVPLRGSGELTLKICNTTTMYLSNPEASVADFAHHFELAGVAITESEYRPRIKLVKEDSGGNTSPSFCPIHAISRSGAAPDSRHTLTSAAKLMEVPGCSNSQWP
jgi:hypothetical protein